MRIYIVGTGGVGGYFGGLLAKAGNDVTFIARGNHYEAIKKDGLRIKSEDGDFVIKPASVIKTISDIKNPDLIIFTVKTYDTASASEELAKVVNQKTIVISFQNGVDNDNEIKKYVKNARVYPGVAYIISTKIRPGVISQSGGARWLIFGGRNNPNNNELKNVETLMRKAHIDARCSDDITRDLWKKFMFIVAYAGMTAICRSPIGEVMADPLTKSLYGRCVKEAIEVGKAKKVNISENAFETIMKVTLNTSPESKSSLLVDIENGRKNEIETLNGTLVRFAKEKNIDASINEMIYGAIKLLNR